MHQNSSTAQIKSKNFTGVIPPYPLSGRGRPPPAPTPSTVATRPIIRGRESRGSNPKKILDHAFPQCSRAVDATAGKTPFHLLLINNNRSASRRDPSLDTCFITSNSTKFHLQQCRVQKIFPGVIPPDSRSRGGERSGPPPPIQIPGYATVLVCCCY